MPYGMGLGVDRLGGWWPKPATQCLVMQVLLLAGCASQPIALDDSEQHLIGHPQSQVAECLGSPSRTCDDGATSVWTYDVGASPNGSAQSCSLNVIFKDKYVSSVTSTDVSGNPLPFGQQCWKVDQGWCSNVQQVPAASKK